MGILTALVAKTFYYPSILWNAIVNPISGQSWYSRIDESIILGAIPLPYMTKDLVKQQVKGVIALNEDYELKYLYNSEKRWNSHGIELLRIPTPDLFAAPTPQQITTALEFIERVKANSGGSVYVHCKAGKTRSTTVVMCYLMKHRALSQQDALTLIKSKRPQIWLRQTQLDCIHSYYLTEIEQKS